MGNGVDGDELECFRVPFDCYSYFSSGWVAGERLVGRIETKASPLAR